MQVEIQTTADGSPTLYRPDMDEHYHSVKGALTESQHIFIDCAMKHCDKDRIRILEIGFGTGLNALLSATQCKCPTEYFSLELYPLDIEIIRKAGYCDMFNNPDFKEIFLALHNTPWDNPAEITPSFTLNKIQCDFTNPSTILPSEIDVVYFDAFAPEKQPEMWDEALLKRIFDCMAEGGILTTYCAKGEIRRRLQSIGFIVERLAGPPGGKREILRATKQTIA